MNISSTIYGIHSIIEALRSGQELSEIWLVSKKNSMKISLDSRLKEIEKLAQEKGAKVLYKSRQDFSTLQNLQKKKRDDNSYGLRSPFRENPIQDQGVLAFLKREIFVYSSLKEFLAQVSQRRKNTPYLFVILDEIQDPQNLGAILRSSEYFDVTAVILPRRRSASLSPAVHKSSCGASFYLPLIQVPNLVECVKELKRQEFWIYGLSLDGKNLSEEDQKNLTGKMAWVLGSEEKGIGPLLKKHCDVLFRIPRLGNIASLNVSVTCGIALYEIQKKRWQN